MKKRFLIKFRPNKNSYSTKVDTFNFSAKDIDEALQTLRKIFRNCEIISWEEKK